MAFSQSNITHQQHATGNGNEAPKQASRAAVSQDEGEYAADRGQVGRHVASIRRDSRQEDLP